MNQKRFLGIDFFKIIAAYGVVSIHGLGGVTLDKQAIELNQLFPIFSVPFFLATAFYFTTVSFQTGKQNHFLQKRLQRILIPFLAWSVIYLAARGLKQILANDGSLTKLIADPINLLFGAAGVQLYFLPMLATGTFAFLIVATLLREKNLFWMIFLTLVSLWLSNWLISSQNSFILGKGVAFSGLLPSLAWHPFFRIMLVLIAWIIQCLPYILLSLILVNFILPNIKENSIQSKFISLIAFITMGFMLTLKYLDSGMPFISIGLSYSVFILGFFLSGAFKQFSLIGNISKLAFGIYLIHGLFTDGLTLVLSKIFSISFSSPLSSIQLFLFSTTIFGLSWGISYLISRNRTASKLLLGM